MKNRFSVRYLRRTKNTVNILLKNLLDLFFGAISYWAIGWFQTDMEFVKNFTLPDFQAKNFIPSISPNFNSFSDKNTKK